jgi:uncharacterized protein (TIGR02145 family)
MKTKNLQIIFLVVIAVCLSLKLVSQTGTLTLTFTGDNNGQPVSLESVWVKNLTQNCDTTLYPPDFMLVIDTILTSQANPANSGNGFTVSQNYPNPFTDQTMISIYLPEKDIVEIRVLNLTGQQLTFYSGWLSSGLNDFQFFSGKDKVYLISVNYRNETRSIRMVASGKGIIPECKLKYTGIMGSESAKSVEVKNYFDFNPGDQLLFVGNASPGESGLLDSPTENRDYIFQFATNIPCIGTPAVEYEGQTYNTIQIYSQCWFKENLNVGEMFPAAQSQTNNNIIEKYCPLDDEYYCNNFAGALYQWSEMMNYAFEPQGQGICPDGWHIPTDTDWKVLEGSADSNYGIGNPEWDNIDWRGSDAGGNLKQTGTTNWMPPNTGATDAFGFSALPGGYVVQNEYWGGEWKGYFWSSHTSGHYFRNMDWNQVMIQRGNGVGGGLAISVRCLKD